MPFLFSVKIRNSLFLGQFLLIQWGWGGDIIEIVLQSSSNSKWRWLRRKYMMLMRILET
jgi:hypothetical protein